MRRAYLSKRFSMDSMNTIRTATSICEEYQAAGYDLTLRQLYYQFVARGLIPNKDTEYKRLGSVINDARMAGLLDWDFIVDRTRFVRSLAHWETPADLLNTAAKQFRINLWDRQKVRPEVWIEKDALVGVIEQVCERWDVPYFSCRGYTSQSEMWGAAQRLGGYLRNGQTVEIFHFGDHDPSGIDMSRDIEDRLRNFIIGDAANDAYGDGMTEVDEYTAYAMERGEGFRITRVALNMDQVDEYNPPPNPAKLTDSRARDYIESYGRESWELDALEPQVIEQLIEEEIEQLVDWDAWTEDKGRITRGRERLVEIAANWEE